jgi:hypothetical protein
MLTPTCAHEDEIPSDQGGIDASRDLPILLLLVEQAEDEQQEQNRLAALTSAVARMVEQRLPVTAVSFLAGAEEAGGESGFAGRAHAELTARLQQGFRRLLLVPWGARQRMGSLLEPAQRAICTATGEPVSLTELTLPHVHVDGLSARDAFEGYRSIQAQLSPLLEAFPGWDRRWVRLAAGNVRIVLLRTSEWTEQLLRSAAWEKPTIKALTAALDLQSAGFMTASERSRWQRDGQIYSHYLASLLCAAADFLVREQESSLCQTLMGQEAPTLQNGVTRWA